MCIRSPLICASVCAAAKFYMCNVRICVPMCMEWEWSGNICLLTPVNNLSTPYILLNAYVNLKYTIQLNLLYLDFILSVSRYSEVVVDYNICTFTCMIYSFLRVVVVVLYMCQCKYVYTYNIFFYARRGGGGGDPQEDLAWQRPLIASSYILHHPNILIMNISSNIFFMYCHVYIASSYILHHLTL